MSMSKSLFATAGMIAVVMAGCGKSVDDAAAPAGSPAAAAHTHSGWWCDEHGVPEDVCALCSTKLAADFKAKGDWCREHDRPESQCFVCHPEKQAEFAALYEAKYGHEPPPIHGSDGHEHDHPHGDDS